MINIVAGQQASAPGKARKRRLSGTAIGVSVAAHLVVLAIIGANVPKMVYREPPLTAVNLWLMPRLTPEQHKPVQPAAQPAPRAALQTPLKPEAKPVRPLPPTPAPAQSAPAPTASKGAAGAAKSGGGANAPSEVGVDGGQGVREALRTSVGCDADHIVHLTPAERDRCNQSVGQMAKTQAPFSGLDPLKRGRFDDQAAADERKRASRTGPMQEVMPACAASTPGSNLGGACLPDSALAHVH